MDIFCVCVVSFCLFVLTKHTWFLPNAHLVYHQTSSLQQESLNSTETSIISNALNTKLISLYLVFRFPANLHPWQQVWCRENKYISFLNIHQLELHESWRQTVPSRVVSQLQGLALQRVEKGPPFRPKAFL